MNIFVRKYKLFKYNWKGKESKLTQLLSIGCLGVLLLNSIIRLIFRERVDFPLMYVPFIVVALQFIIFMRYKKFMDKENKHFELAIDSHEKFSREIMDGYFSVDELTHQDYLKYKMYLAYPLKEWTPVWETIAEKN